MQKSRLEDGLPHRIEMCAMDFIRKIHEHSRLRQFLFRLICGKHAFREYEIMFINFDVCGYNMDAGYELENCSYHKKSIAELRRGLEDDRAS